MPTQLSGPRLDLIQPVRALRYTRYAQLFLPFSVAPPRDVLRYLSEDVSDATALFLGCGDASCLLASMAVEHPGLKQLLAVLNDHNASLLARAALLLYMAAELDPNSQDDMCLLWEVWYCSTWGPDTWPRVKPFVERLAQGSVPWLTPLRPEDTAALQQVWRWWLDQKCKTSTARVPQRDATLTAKLKLFGVATSDNLAKCSEYESSVLKTIVQMMVKLGSLDTLLHVLGMNFKQLEDVFKRELTTWFQTGTLAPGYTGQEPSKAHMANITFMQAGDNRWRSININHPFLPWGPFTASELKSAFTSGSSAGVLARACIARITQMVRSFQAHTQPGHTAETNAVTLQGSGGSRGGGTGQKVQLHVQLVCMDALQLCLGMPHCKPAGSSPVPYQRGCSKSAKPQSAAPATVSVPAAPLMFHVIDTSMLLDDVGLLALLVAAAPRLAPGGHLYTSSHHWHQKKCETLLHFLTEQALCMPLSLTPTILGLRLLTDLSVDRPDTPEAQDYNYRTDGFVELVWSPIPAELRASPLPQLQPQVLGGPAGSIEAVLKTIAEQLCCVNTHLDPQGVRSLVCGTPQLLAWLLASMIQRVDMSAMLDSSSKAGSSSSSSTGVATSVKNNSSQGSNRGGGGSSSGSSSAGSTQEASTQATYATTQRLLCALRTKVAPLLQHTSQSCFKAGIDILRLSLQQNAPQSWLPADVPACRGLVQLDLAIPQGSQDTPASIWPLRPWIIDDFCRARKILFVDKATGHQLAVTQEVDSKVSQPTEVNYDTKGVHLADFFSMESSDKISLFLPADHDISLQHVRIMGMGLHPDLDKSPQLRPSKPLTLGTVFAPPTLAQVLLPAACLSTAAQHQHAAQQRQQGRMSSGHSLVLLVKSMTEDAHSYHAVLQLQQVSAHQSVSIEQVTPADVQVQLMDEKHQEHHDGDEHQPETSCSTSHRLLVTVAEPAGVQPCELVLPWPVAVGLKETDIVGADCYSSGDGRKAMLDTTTQQVYLHLRKAEAWELWPGDEHWPGAAEPLDLARLASLHESAAKPLIQECCRVEPPSCAAILKDMGLRSENDRGAFTSVRDMVRTLMTLAAAEAPFRACISFQLGDKQETGPYKLKSSELLVTIQAPLLVTQAGRPVLPVAVMDISMQRSAGLVGDDKVLPENAVQTKVTPEVLHLLRRMLLRNAMACQPTAAQNTLLPVHQIPYSYGSYISFMHPQGAISHLYSAHMVQAPIQKPRKPLNRQAEYISNRLQELLVMSRTPNLEDLPALAAEARQLLDLPDAAQLPPEVPLLWKLWLLLVDVETQATTETHSHDAAGTDTGANANGADPSSGAAAGASTSAAAGSMAVGSIGTTESCAQCHRRDGKLMKCGKCGAVQYCSRECQVAHWKQHKMVCRG